MFLKIARYPKGQYQIDLKNMKTDFRQIYY